jgi:hypothetical protein
MFEAIMNGNANISIIRKTVSGYTKHNLPEVETEEIEVRGLFSQNSSSQPNEVNRDEILTDANIYLPNGTEILDTDSFTVDGVAYEKVGDPVITVSPFPGFPPPPVIIKIRKSDG